MTAGRGGRPLRAALALAACLGAASGSQSVEPPATLLDLSTHAGQSRLVREASLIRPGEAASRPFLGSGWGEPELLPNGNGFAWAEQPNVEVELVLLKPAYSRLQLRCKPLVVAGREQWVEAELNGVLLGRVVLAASMRQYQLPLPADSVLMGRNRLRLRFAYADSPPARPGEPRDERKLAAAFESITVLGASAVPLAEPAAVTDSPGTLSVPTASARVFTLGVPQGASLDVGLDPSTSAELEASVWVGHTGKAPRQALALSGEQASAGRRTIDLAAVAGGGAEVWFVTRGTPRPGGRPRAVWQRPLLVGRAVAPDAVSNVLLVVVDTLRADHVGCYGSSHPTPSMDAVAAAGVRFAAAYSQIPITGPSHASLFTSRLPMETGVHNNAQRLPEEAETLAEELRLWYRSTAGFVSLGVLKGEFGFRQGFDEYSDAFPLDWFKDAREVTDEVVDWLADAPTQPFFLWVHYSDPHEPYTPPDRQYPRIVVRQGGDVVGSFSVNGRTNSLRVTAPPGKSLLRFDAGEPAPSHRVELFSLWVDGASGCTVRPHSGWWKPKEGAGPPKLSTSLPAAFAVDNPRNEPRPVELRFYCKELLRAEESREAYASEVAFVDHELGRLLTALRDGGYLDSTLLVLTSDHGESLGEHGLTGHITQLYEPLLRVPLMVSFPGKVPAGKVIDQPVSLLDVAPTVLQLLGLPPPKGARGRTLVPLLHGGRLDDAPVVAETYRPEAPADLRAVVAARRKLIVRLDRDQGVELYDLARDPAELENLSGSTPALVAELRAVMAGATAGGAGPGPAPVEVPLTDEEKARLRALGYLRD